MPQAVWTGTISFGLVSVPVKLYPATRKKDVRFKEIDRLTGQRVRHQRVRPEPLPFEPRLDEVVCPEPPAAGRGEMAARPLRQRREASAPATPVGLSRKERDMAALLVNTLSGPFEPERFRDEYRDRLTRLIQGRAPSAQPAPEPVGSGRVQDLMAALKASVEAAKRSRRPAPTKARATPKPKPAPRRRRKHAQSTI